MAKRRAAAQSDDDAGSEPTSKRSRTLDNSDDDSEEASRPNPGVTGKAKEKRRARDERSDQEEDDDDAGVYDPDEDEEKKFEEENEGKIRERVMNKSKSQGGVAEMGIIESLEMHQFMCHKYLTFSFGPQINFIIGHNGSGKSAVLSALTVALGGKATSTGRGAGLKSFIREGQNVAEVTVMLKNQGEEAYKPKEYGRSIVITRRFTKEGSSSYKIKSRDGKVISTKREELQAICDHMNIQVDNPMNILTQDSARQFLSASSPGDKYKFFLKGTQLSQLSEEYQTCMENISQTAKVLKRKAEVIPDLEEAYAEAKARFEEAKKAREQRHKADELKKELAWAHVATKEEELEQSVTEVANVQRRVDKYENQLKEAEARLVIANNKVLALEEEIEALGNVDTLTQSREAVNDEIKKGKSKLLQLQVDEKTMVESMSGVNKTIADFQKQIEDEQARLETRSKAKRDEATARLTQANTESTQIDERLKDVAHERQQVQGQIVGNKDEIARLTQEQSQLRGHIVSCDHNIEQCSLLEKSKLAAFGRNMEHVLSDIKKQRWHGQPPVGPFGMYVKVKEPERWSELLQVIIGGAMSSFAITDARDRPVLAKILNDSGNRNSQIIISEVDMFDYTRGEPPQQYLTILRALEISDQYVLRQLVNTLSIESALLASTRADADQMLLSMGTGGVVLAADLFRVVRFPEGGGHSTIIHKLNDKDPRKHLFRSGTAETEKRRWFADRQRHESNLSDVDRQLRELNATAQRLQTDERRLGIEEQQLNRRRREVKNIINDLQQELNEDMPVNVQALQDALQEQESEKESIKQQYAHLALEKQRVANDQRPLMEKYNALRLKITEFSDKKQALTDSMSGLVTERMTEDNNIAHCTKKMQAERAKLKDAQAAAETVEKEFQAWTDKASEYCERFLNPRKADIVKRNLDAVQAALKQREKREGASIEVIADELNRKEVTLQTAKKELKALKSLNSALKKSVKTRLARWHEFRRHIALRCKVYFGYHLSNRGYFGKVLFDHVNGKLELKVQTDDQNLTQQNNRDKDPRSLSGGEKSFSTICLLLSLWESIGCPIRCLDEFDVFMDAVNRRISMKMMIDTANTSNRKQYVLITPQDMNNIHIGNTVRVHRMTDPERGQGTLAFQ